MQKTLKEKFDDLVNNKFSEEASLNFFGSLNENEIKAMQLHIQNENSSSLNFEQKEYLLAYLKKLLDKIEEIKKTG